MKGQGCGKLTYFSSKHCDHSEIMIKPSTAAKFSESGLRVSVEILSSRMVERARSRSEGNANVAKRSNVLGSSDVKRWSNTFCVSFGSRRQLSHFNAPVHQTLNLWSCRIGAGRDNWSLSE